MTDEQPYLTYRTGVGYFWGPGHPTKAGQPASWVPDILPTDKTELWQLQEFQDVIHLAIQAQNWSVLEFVAGCLRDAVWRRFEYREAAATMARNALALVEDRKLLALVVSFEKEAARGRWRYKMLHLARRWRHHPKFARRLRRIAWT